MAISIYIDADTIRNLSMNVNTEHLSEDAKRLLDGLNSMAAAAVTEHPNKAIALTDVSAYKASVLWHGREDVEYLLENEQFLESNQKELDSFSPEELESFIDTVTAAVDWDGPVFTSCGNGYQVISNAIERQLEISRNSRRLFVLDQELTVEDDAHECIDGYLWATNGLMSKLAYQVGAKTMMSMSQDDCPNFFATYNLREQSVTVYGTYWIPGDPTTGREEKHYCEELSLTDAEKEDLISSLEGYCKRVYAIDCLGFVNEARGYNHLPELQGPSLNAQIQSAAARQAAQAQTAQQPEREAARA